MFRNYTYLQKAIFHVFVGGYGTPVIIKFYGNLRRKQIDCYPERSLLRSNHTRIKTMYGLSIRYLYS
jgi:hypothetical protein